MSFALENYFEFVCIVKFVVPFSNMISLDLNTTFVDYSSSL